MPSSESWNTSLSGEVEEMTTDVEEEPISSATEIDDTIQQSTEQPHAQSAMSSSQDSNLSGSHELDEESTDLGQESVSPKTGTESVTTHRSVEQPHVQYTDMSGSEDLNLTLSPDLGEESTNAEEESTSPMIQTESETTQQSIDENKAISEIGHDARGLDRDNVHLRALIEEMNLLNARQQEECGLLEEELQDIKAALHDEQTRNDANESYINMAEQSNQHFQEENSKQADLLDTYANERTRLAHELDSRERAMGELQISLQETDQLTEKYERVINSFRKERKEWKKVGKPKTVSEQNKELQERLSSAIKVGEKFENMVRTFRSRASLHRLEFDIIRGRIGNRRIAGRRARRGAIRAASDEAIDDVLGNQLGLRIRSAKSPDDMMKPDGSISSEFGRMAIDSESEYASGTESEFETAMESTVETTEVEQMGAEVELKGYSQQHNKAHQSRGNPWHDRTHQQIHPDERPRNLFQQLIDDKRAKIRSDERASTALQNLQHVAQKAHPKQVYSKEMDWKMTKAPYLPTSPTNLHEFDATMLARKRRRSHISTEDAVMVDADEERTSWPVKQVKVCPWCETDDRQDTMRLDVGDSNTRSTAAECLTHKGRTVLAGVQTEHGTAGVQSDRPRELVSAGTQVEERPTASASTQTKETETNPSGVYTGYSSEVSKIIQEKRISMLFRNPQADPVHVWTPTNGSLPSPSWGKQKRQKSVRKVHIRGQRWDNGSEMAEKRQGRVNSMPNSLAGHSTQLQDEPENKVRMALQPSPRIIWTDWMAPAACLVLLGLGLVVYIYLWRSTKEEELWMKANRVPRNVLRELRNNAAHEVGWRDKVNYELVQWLNIDRVAPG